MKKIALITGITGQDGSYLAELLLKKDYTVHGIKRRSSVFNTKRIDHIIESKNKNFFLHFGDMTDSLSLSRIIYEIMPDEIYNLAAMSHVKVSFETPEYVANVDGLGTLRILEIIRALSPLKKIKLYQASTSELYGNAKTFPQSETTPFNPRSPYAVAKLYSHWITINYREAYGIHACNGILFNHESSRRGETFVTRKIIIGIVKILSKKQDYITLGNLDSKRDWGHAKDYVDAMWRILQIDQAEDWVIATGKSYSIRDFIKLSFSYFGIQIKFKGEGTNEVGYVYNCSNKKYNINKGKNVVKIDAKYYRPTEVNVLVGDSTKAKKQLNWKPKYTLKAIIEEMIEEELKNSKIS